jgi:hypothetical protein
MGIPDSHLRYLRPGFLFDTEGLTFFNDEAPTAEGWNDEYVLQMTFRRLHTIIEIPVQYITGVHEGKVS